MANENSFLLLRSTYDWQHFNLPVLKKKKKNFCYHVYSYSIQISYRAMNIFWVFVFVIFTVSFRWNKYQLHLFLFFFSFFFGAGGGGYRNKTTANPWHQIHESSTLLKRQLIVLSLYAFVTCKSLELGLRRIYYVNIYN